MSDYTPTTEEVRKAYIGNRWSLDQEFERLAGPEVDRWLAAERARVWDEGYAARQADLGAADRTPNPYRRETP